MGVEIERKFLVAGDGWRVASDGGTELIQGYISTDPDRVVRARVAGHRGTITLKGRSDGAARAEFEWSIPADDARQVLHTLAVPPLIEKVRHRVEHAGHTWEIDVFGGRNAGLVVAEVELEREDEEVALPDWVGEEVTGDHRYANSSLVAAPFDTWG